MSEIYIAKGNKETLTRVSLEIGNEKYIVESPYSDSDTIETLIRCAEGYCLSNGYTRNDIIAAMENIINDKSESFNKINCINGMEIKATVEQYDSRFITVKVCGLNIIRTILDCVVAVNIETSWAKEPILKWFQEYVDEYTETENGEEE